LIYQHLHRQYGVMGTTVTPAKYIDLVANQLAHRNCGNFFVAGVLPPAFETSHEEIDDLEPKIEHNKNIWGGQYGARDAVSVSDW
jgi:hypothetical protein